MEKLIRLKKIRADFSERFEELRELQQRQPEHGRFVRAVGEIEPQPQRRAATRVRKEITGTELVIIDTSHTPAPELSEPERAEARRVARQLE